jgi:hypothetical protein
MFGYRLAVGLIIGSTPAPARARYPQQPQSYQANEPRARGQSVSIVGRQLALPM